MAWRAEGAEDLPHELGPSASEWLEQPPVGVRVRTEAACRLLHGAFEQHRGAVVEWMRQRCVGMHQLEPVLGERQPAQERRCERQRVHRGAGVVHEAWERQLFGAAAPTDGLRAFEDGDPPAGRGQHGGGGEAVRARPDYDGVGRGIRQPRDRV